jgi:hypothetical protein
MKIPDKWTTIATHTDTKKRLYEMKIIKEPGKIENYDDVIRRKLNMPPLKEQEKTE